MRAAIDIRFLRALNAPFFCPTWVLSVRITVKSGEVVVCRVMVAPLRDLIWPCTLTACADTNVPRKAKTHQRMIRDLNTLFFIINFLLLVSVQAIGFKSQSSLAT